MRTPRRCEACGTRNELTKHHVYPKSLRDAWRRRVTQRLVPLCRLCHDVVHLPGGLAFVRHEARRDPRWQAYKDRITDPTIQQVLGPYRRIIRELERDYRARRGTLI